MLALSNHSQYQSHPGQALTHAEEAVERARELYTMDPSRVALLGQALCVAANRLVESGEPQPALAYSREALVLTERALAIWGELAAAAPLGSEAHREYGRTLHNHANRLYRVGRRDDAARVGAEAVAWYREPSSLNRADRLSTLAQVLDNHATVLAGVDRHDDALAAAEEAVTISRDLAHRPRLASALRSYGARLLAVRGAAEACPATAESVRLYRELAADDHRAYRSPLAEAVRPGASVPA